MWQQYPWLILQPSAYAQMRKIKRWNNWTNVFVTMKPENYIRKKNQIKWFCDEECSEGAATTKHILATSLITKSQTCITL